MVSNRILKKSLSQEWWHKPQVSITMHLNPTILCCKAEKFSILPSNKTPFPLVNIYLMLFTKNKQKKHFPCLRNSQARNGVIFRNSKHFKHTYTHTQEKRCILDKKDQNSWSSEGILCFHLTKPWSMCGKGMNGTDSVLTMNRTLTCTYTEVPSNKPGDVSAFGFLMETTHTEQLTQGQTLSSSLSSCSETSPQKDFSVPGCSHKFLDVVKLLESTNTDQRILGIFSSLQSYFSVCVWNWAKQLLVFCVKENNPDIYYNQAFLKKNS